MKTRKITRIKPTVFVFLSVLAVVAAVVAAPVYSGRASGSSSLQRFFAGLSARTDASGAMKTETAPARWSSVLSTVFAPAPPAIGLTTYAADCTTPKSSFNLGETVCAKITGATLFANGRATTRIGWVSPYNSLAQGAAITTDPQTGTYSIPATPTQTFTDVGGGSITVDNRGVWTLGLYSALDGSFIQGVNFTVHDPAKEFVDLSVNQAASFSEGEVGSGSGSIFRITVSNRGPDAAHSVVLTDTLPTNVTFSSAVETTSLGFTCNAPSGGTFTCTLATMPAGSTAQITLAYEVNTGVAEGTAITNTVTVDSSAAQCSPDASCELRPEDNTSTFSAKVPETPANPTCTLICHENFSVVANTTQSGNPGAIVTFAAGSVFGTCGAISANPASGSFFPVGTTVVNVSSETGGGSCSFTITVVEGTPPSIMCPAGVTATADGGGTHTFTAAEIGTPTTNPSTNVVVTYERSDNIDPTYDQNGDIVTPGTVYSLTDPFPTGSTGITWTVTDANGLSASCTQTVLVHEPCASDAEAPTITAPPAVSVSTGPNSTTCGVVLDNELGEPTVHDDCSATVSSSGIPPGNLFPVGTTTVTYTATDGGGRTASATQQVTVIDNTPPVIFAPANASYTCPEEVPALNPSQAYGPDLIDDGIDAPGPVFDNCGSPVVTASQTTSGVGSTASPRIITRTYTAVDTHGNSASAVQVITVTDGTPPSITAPANVTAYTGPGATSCDTVVSNAVLGTATATDNCAGVTVTRSPSGNTFPVGTTTVTWTATDWAGNTASATQTVTVIDNTPPTITLNGQTPSMWPPNHKYQTFNVTNFVTSVFDNCGGVAVSDVKIDHVTSDETENGNGDGNTTNDIVIGADCKSVQLRSERDGGGNGRVYTIYFRLTDTHGNTTTVTAKVVVQHNPGETAVDSGPHYTVNGGCP